MPIYDYRCEKCRKELSLVRSMDANCPTCCGQAMVRLLTTPALIKIKGMGGYPSRRKFLHGTAPYTTRSTKPWLSVDPSEKVNYLGTRDFEADNRTED